VAWFSSVVFAFSFASLVSFLRLLLLYRKATATAKAFRSVFSFSVFGYSVIRLFRLFRFSEMASMKRRTAAGAEQLEKSL